MSILTVINSLRGIIQYNGSSGLYVEQDGGNVGFGPYALQQNSVGLAFTVAVPGFYSVSGSTACTGTIPPASSMPGAELLFMMTNNSTLFLTGSSRSSNNPAGVFTSNGIASSSLNKQFGDGLTVPGSGSVKLCSDGRYWIPQMSSGSLVVV